MSGVTEARANAPCTGHPRHSLFQQGGKIYNKAYQNESIHPLPLFLPEGILLSILSQSKPCSTFTNFTTPLHFSPDHPCGLFRHLPATQWGQEIPASSEFPAT